MRSATTQEPGYRPSGAGGDARTVPAGGRGVAAPGARRVRADCGGPPAGRLARTAGGRGSVVRRGAGPARTGVQHASGRHAGRAGWSRGRQRQNPVSCPARALPWL